MGKKHKGRGIQRGEKADFSLEDRLKKENRQLKKEVKRLRSLLARADIERLEHLENVVKEQREFDKTIKRERKVAKEKWQCYECGRGYMIPRIFPRRDGDFYYRVCNNERCEHRTRMKKVTKNVDLSMMEEK